jgi:putative DNA primase/helicase
MEIAKMRGVSLIVFDNLAALTPGVDENTRIDFDPINGWLKDLRHDGISSILCSHTGKNNQQRGTSSHEDALNITIELRPQPKAPRSEYSNHCSFSMRTTKDRSMDTLYECVLFDLESTEKGVEFAYAIPTPSELDRVVVLLKGDPDISPAEARSKYEISKRTYYRAREILKKGLD